MRLVGWLAISVTAVVVALIVWLNNFGVMISSAMEERLGLYGWTVSPSRKWDLKSRLYYGDNDTVVLTRDRSVTEGECVELIIQIIDLARGEYGDRPGTGLFDIQCDVSGPGLSDDGKNRLLHITKENGAIIHSIFVNKRQITR